MIFITENDVVGTGLSLYHVERVIKETGADFGDGSHIIYVNGSYQNDNEPIGKRKYEMQRMLHLFFCLFKNLYVNK